MDGFSGVLDKFIALGLRINRKRFFYELSK